MKYADLVGKDTGVDLMDCIAEATKNSLDVGHARSAMNIFNKNGGAPKKITAAMHDYYRQTRNLRWRARATATRADFVKKEDDVGSK